MQREKKNEILAIIFLAIGAFILLSLITFDPNDIPLYTSTLNSPVKNFAGSIGAYTSGILFFLMGVSAYVIPTLFLLWGINRLFGIVIQRLSTRLTGTAILILSASSLASMIVDGSAVEEFRYGGTFGFFLSKIMVKYCGVIGSYLIFSALLILSLVLATEFMIFPALLKLNNALVIFSKKVKAKITAPSIKFAERKKTVAKTPKLEEMISIFKGKAFKKEPVKEKVEQPKGPQIIQPKK